MSPKIIKKGSFDSSKIKKFDEELSPNRLGSDSHLSETPTFEKNVYHAKKIAIFQDSQNQAREIIENAKKEALAEAERIRKEAFENGYNDGMSKAVSEGKSYVADAVKSFSSLINELTDYKKALIKEAEKQLLSLSVEIANKIIIAKLEESDEYIVNVVKKAIKNLIDRESITIRLNPKDIEIMKKEKVNLMQEVDGIKKLTIIEDESIQRGGCHIETASSEVDARIDKQLDIVKKTLER